MPWYCNLQRMRTIFKIMTELCVFGNDLNPEKFEGLLLLECFYPSLLLSHFHFLFHFFFCFSHTWKQFQNCTKLPRRWRWSFHKLSCSVIKQELCLQPVLKVSCGNIASCLKTRKMKKQNARYPDVHLSTVCSHLRSVKVAFMRKTWPNRRLELDRWALNCAKKRIQGFRFTPRKANTRMDTTPGGKGLGKI